MREWWQEFVSMPDGERAKILATICACVIILLLYCLGGLSLYLRAHYLEPGVTRTPTPTVAPQITTAPIVVETHTPTTAPLRTLYPTLTPKR